MRDKQRFIIFSYLVINMLNQIYDKWEIKHDNRIYNLNLGSALKNTTQQNFTATVYCVKTKSSMNIVNSERSKTGRKDLHTEKVRTKQLQE